MNFSPECELRPYKNHGRQSHTSPVGARGLEIRDAESVHVTEAATRSGGPGPRTTHKKKAANHKLYLDREPASGKVRQA